MGFDLVEFVKANLGASITAAVVFIAAANSRFVPEGYGIIPLVLAAVAFIAYKRYVK